MSQIGYFAGRTQLPPDTQEAQQDRNLNAPLFEPNAAARAAIDSFGSKVGERKGESVEMLNLPAADLLANLQDNAEELGAFLAGRIPLGNMTQRAGRKAVAGKGSSPDIESTSSPTSDTDEQRDQILRLLAFREFSGGDAGTEQNQQQRQYAQLARVTGEKIRQATGNLLKGLSAIRDEMATRAALAGAGEIGLTDAQRRDIHGQIWMALHAYDTDAVQQLAALEIIFGHFSTDNPTDEAFQSVLLGIRNEFDEATVGRVVRETLSAINRLAVTSATLESSPALFREQQRQLLQESKNFSNIFETLQKSDPLRTLREVVGDFMAGAGSNLADGNGPALDDDFRHRLLTELAVLKKLNSVFDHVQQMVVEPMHIIARRFDNGTPGKKTLDATNVTRAVLGFVSNDNVDRSAIRPLEAVLPNNAALQDRVVYSTCIASLHKQLPDDLFPNGQINGDQTHRNAQDSVLKLWRAELAIEDEAKAA
ncbi:hypothetical protein ACFFJ7_03320 [Pseudochelatococcus lubricantis]|uniref:hypothetical protein n=1 Tax=Pseudochelatococcus lubricantis TaxID=1538102 RepID=UPI0035E80B14